MPRFNDYDLNDLNDLDSDRDWIPSGIDSDRMDHYSTDEDEDLDEELDEDLLDLLDDLDAGEYPADASGYYGEEDSDDL